MDAWFTAITELPDNAQWLRTVKELLLLERILKDAPSPQKTSLPLPASGQPKLQTVLASPDNISDLVDALVVRRRLLPALKQELPLEIQLEVCKHLLAPRPVVSVTASSSKPGTGTLGHVVDTTVDGKPKKLWVMGTSLLNPESQRLPIPEHWSRLPSGETSHVCRDTQASAVQEGLRLDAGFQGMLAEEWFKQCHFVVYHIYELPDFLCGSAVYQDFATPRDMLRHISINLSAYDCRALQGGQEDVCSLVRSLNAIRNQRATIDFYIYGGGPFSAFRKTAGFPDHDDAMKATMVDLEYAIAPRLRQLINPGYNVRIGRQIREGRSKKSLHTKYTQTTVDAPAHLHSPTWYYKVPVILRRLEEIIAESAPC